MANKNTIHPTKHSSVSPNRYTNSATDLDKDSSSSPSKKNKRDSVEANVKSLGIGFLNINEMYDDDAEVEFQDQRGEENMNQHNNEESTTESMLGNTIVVEKDLQYHRNGSVRWLGYNDGISAVSLSFSFNSSSRIKSSLSHKNEAHPSIRKRILNWAKFKRNHSKH